MVFEKNKLPLFLTAAAWLILVFIALATPGTGDDGDSVHHFLYAKYAFQHPANFFNHWAKPIYVMLAAPFAQFGFIGVKLMNASLLAFQIWLLLKIADHFELKNSWLLPVFSLAAPMNLTHSLSGLTEPLFAVWLASAILLRLSNKPAWAYFLFSLLPFVRSEGLVVMCPVIIYMIWRRDFKWLPMLAAGHVIMGLAGWPIHGDPLWIFNKIPYATLDAAYGIGTWSHFFIRFPDIIGWVLCGLLIIGLIEGLVRLVIQKRWLSEPKSRDEAWLIYAIFIAFFTAHVIFWAEGIFKSFGLLRVFLGVMPCLMIIVLRGYNWLIPRFSIKFQPIVLPILLIGMALNLYLHLSWKLDFGLSTAQLAMRKAKAVIDKDFPDKTNTTFYLDAVDVPFALNLDFFDRKQIREGWRFFTGEPVPQQSVVVWDDWFMRVEAGVPLEKFQNDNRLILRGIFEQEETRWVGRSRVVVFYTDSTKITNAGNVFFINKFDTISTKNGGIEMAGHRCQIVDKKHPYSNGFEGGLISFQPESEIEISFEAMTTDTTHASGASMVLEASGDGKVIDWRARDIKMDLLQAKGNWRTFRFIEKIPKGSENNSRLKIYLWNDYEIPIYLDNLEVKQH